MADGKTVDADYIAKYWPGGALNDRKDLKGWVRCYGVLTGLTRLFDKTQQPSQIAARRAAILDAIAEVPETVALVQRDAEGETRTLTVYQKSDLALRLIHSINVILASLVDDYQILTTHGTQDDTELVVRLLAEQSYQQRLLVWIATTPGPGLPFSESETRPELPPPLADLHPLDFYTIAQAFHRVNVAGFAALESSTAPKSRADWSVFFTAMEFETGTPVPRLMRDRGLLSLVATAGEHARGRAEAEDRAKHQRKAG